MCNCVSTMNLTTCLCDCFSRVTVVIQDQRDCLGQGELLVLLDLLVLQEALEREEMWYAISFLYSIAKMFCVNTMGVLYILHANSLCLCKLSRQGSRGPVGPPGPAGKRGLPVRDFCYLKKSSILSTIWRLVFQILRMPQSSMAWSSREQNWLKLSGKEEWHTLSPVNYRNTSQSSVIVLWLFFYYCIALN